MSLVAISFYALSLVRFYLGRASFILQRFCSPSFVVLSQSLIDLIVSVITSWFAIGLTEIRTRRILREKAGWKQSTKI